jgi:hypothetical protein
MFIDFYESKGWMVGSNKMKDWKAAVRTWEKKDGRRKEEPRKDDNGNDSETHEFTDEELKAYEQFKIKGFM